MTELYDYYYSEKMQEHFRHTGNWRGTIHGKPFTCKVEHGMPHGLKWDDVKFVGTFPRLDAVVTGSHNFAGVR